MFAEKPPFGIPSILNKNVLPEAGIKLEARQLIKRTKSKAKIFIILILQTQLSQSQINSEQALLFLIGFEYALKPKISDKKQLIQVKQSQFGYSNRKNQTKKEDQIICKKIIHQHYIIYAEHILQTPIKYKQLVQRCLYTSQGSKMSQKVISLTQNFFLSMILFIKYHNHKCCNSINLIIHYIHLYKRVLSLTMSVPDHSKKTNHQVIQMGYNTNLIKILILLNIILIIVFSICVFRMSKGRAHQKIDYLNEKIYELQMKINKLTSKNNQNIDESTILQHITLVNDHLEMYQNQGNLVQKQIKLTKAMIHELKESDENQWKKIRNQESKLGQVNQVITKILQNLKPVQRYFESFQAPNMQNFKAKFTETFADLKAKFRKAFNQQNQQKDSSKNDL